MGIWFGPGPAGGNGVFSENDFSYTGTYRFASDGSNAELALLTSGTLTLKKAITASLFLVGGGDSGGKNNFGGKGGNGGECKTESSLSLTKGNYTVVVGTTDADTTVTFPDGETIYKAEHGKGALGGAQTGNNGRSGKDGSTAFGIDTSLVGPGFVYGSGGGQGAYDDYEVGSNSHSAGSGGACGAEGKSEGTGKGGASGSINGTAGLANSGQGGGGGWSYYSSSHHNADGSAGGSGIAIIRVAS